MNRRRSVELLASACGGGLWRWIASITSMHHVEWTLTRARITARRARAVVLLSGTARAILRAIAGFRRRGVIVRRLPRPTNSVHVY